MNSAPGYSDCCRRPHSHILSLNTENNIYTIHQIESFTSFLQLEKWVGKFYVHSRSCRLLCINADCLPPAEYTIFLTNESLQPIVNSFLENVSGYVCSFIKKGMLAGVVRE